MKKGIRKQYGYTMWEMGFFLLTLGFVISAAIMMIPVYMQDSTISNSVKEMHESLAGKDIYEVSNTDIKNKMAKYFQVNQISDEILAQIKIKRDGGKVLFSLDYEVKKPFLGNVDVVMKFSHNVDLASSSGDK